MSTMLWTDAPVLYFHFNTTNGLPASLPMTRVLKTFTSEFKGVPGTRMSHGDAGIEWWVRGYSCPNCRETFFASTADGLKHACMNHGGIVSGRA
jgi:hypothetical protein